MLEQIMELRPDHQMLVGAFMLIIGLGALSWLATVVYLLRIPFNAKPGSLRGWLKFNPFNVVFYSDKLTPIGLVLRRRLFISACCFLLFWSSAWLFGLIAKFVI